MPAESWEEELPGRLLRAGLRTGRPSRRLPHRVRAPRIPQITRRVPREYAAVTPEDVQRAAHAHLHPDVKLIVTSGPEITPRLRGRRRGARPGRGALANAGRSALMSGAPRGGARGPWRPRGPLHVELHAQARGGDDEARRPAVRGELDAFDGDDERASRRLSRSRWGAVVGAASVVPAVSAQRSVSFLVSASRSEEGEQEGALFGAHVRRHVERLGEGLRVGPDPVETAGLGAVADQPKSPQTYRSPVTDGRDLEEAGGELDAELHHAALGDHAAVRGGHVLAQDEIDRPSRERPRIRPWSGPHAG